MSLPTSNDPASPWDQLSDVDVDGIAQNLVEPSIARVNSDEIVPWSTRLSAAWADLVVISAATTSMVGAVILAGYPLGIRALPWAVVVALIGWGATCAILIRVRRGTPGMLLAGFVFSDEVTGGRLVRTVAAAGFNALLLGLPVLPGGSKKSLLSVASGSGIAPTP